MIDPQQVTQLVISCGRFGQHLPYTAEQLKPYVDDRTLYLESGVFPGHKFYLLGKRGAQTLGLTWSQPSEKRTRDDAALSHYLHGGLKRYAMRPEWLKDLLQNPESGQELPESKAVVERHADHWRLMLLYHPQEQTDPKKVASEVRGKLKRLNPADPLFRTRQVGMLVLCDCVPGAEVERPDGIRKVLAKLQRHYPITVEAALCLRNADQLLHESVCPPPT